MFGFGKRKEAPHPTGDETARDLGDATFEDLEVELTGTVAGSDVMPEGEKATFEAVLNKPSLAGQQEESWTHLTPDEEREASQQLRNR